MYYFNNNIKSLEPKKFSIDGDQFKQFIFIKLIIQPYLIAFSTLYITLNKKTKSFFNWRFVFNILKNVLVRIIVGFSLTTIRKADFMATKFLKIKKIKSKSWVDLLFFNYNVEELNSCNMIERLKIYKDDNNKFNFNPNEEKIKVTLSQLFSKIKYKLPTTENEFKIAQKVLWGADEIKKDVIKGYFKSGVTTPHYGIIHPLEEERSDNTQKIIGTNFTSQKITFGLKNEPITKDSFLTQPFITKEKVIEWDEERRFPKNTFDLRNIADQLKIQELWLVSSLGFDKNKYGYYSTKENKFSIIETENKPTLKEYQQTSLQKATTKLNINPGTFKIYKIDADLKELYNNTPENELIEKNTVFNYALSLLFNDAVVVDMLYELANQTTKS